METKLEKTLEETSSKEYTLENAIDDIVNNKIPSGFTDIMLGKLIFPELTTKEIDRIFWNKTGYPNFFSPKPGETSLQIFLRQLLQYKHNVENQKDCCPCCGDTFDVKDKANYDYFNPDLCNGKKCKTMV